MSLTLNPQKVYKPIPYYLSQAGGIDRVQRYEEQSYKWHEDFISRAEDRRRVASTNPLSPFSGMKQRSFLTSQAEVYTWTWCTGFLIECCIADNADLILGALISLPVGSPLLVAATQTTNWIYVLDWKTALLICPAWWDSSRFTGVYGMWWHHIQYFHI